MTGEVLQGVSSQFPEFLGIDRHDGIVEVVLDGVLVDELEVVRQGLLAGVACAVNALLGPSAHALVVHWLANDILVALDSTHIHRVFEEFVFVLSLNDFYQLRLDVNQILFATESAVVLAAFGGEDAHASGGVDGRVTLDMDPVVTHCAFHPLLVLPTLLTRHPTHLAEVSGDDDQVALFAMSLLVDSETVFRQSLPAHLALLTVFT